MKKEFVQAGNVMIASQENISAVISYNQGTDTHTFSIVTTSDSNHQKPVLSMNYTGVAMEFPDKLQSFIDNLIENSDPDMAQKEFLESLVIHPLVAMPLYSN